MRWTGGGGSVIAVRRYGDEKMRKEKVSKAQARLSDVLGGEPFWLRLCNVVIIEHTRVRMSRADSGKNKGVKRKENRRKQAKRRQVKTTPLGWRWTSAVTRRR